MCEDLCPHGLLLSCCDECKEDEIRILQTRIAELEIKLSLCREVQAACIEDDSEGPHYLGRDLYSRFVSAELN